MQFTRMYFFFCTDSIYQKAHRSKSDVCLVIVWLASGHTLLRVCHTDLSIIENAPIEQSD